MEKLLIVGINTRPLARSAFELGYQIYSASYFCTSDFNSYHHKKCILKQKPHYSCGYFQESYNARELEELCSPWIDEIDYIIPYTGVSPQNFPSSKVLGNKNVENVENKYKLYKNLRKKFNVPETFLLSSLKEAFEIRNQKPEKKYLIKPVYGSGGYGIYNLDFFIENRYALNKINRKEEVSKNTHLIDTTSQKFILQEYISGEEVSASIISTNKESLPLISSSQIMSATNSGEADKFIYSGNITPYPGDDSQIKEIGQEVIKHLNLIGSNGVDMIINNGEIQVIEVNPRFQGTFECAESSLGINLIDAHIKACNGELIEPPEVKKYSIKRIFYAPERLIIGKIDIPGVYDIPLENTIIEKGEPVITVLESGKTYQESVKNTENTLNEVKACLRPAN